jgi:hypothetical protein
MSSARSAIFRIIAIAVISLIPGRAMTQDTSDLRLSPSAQALLQHAEITPEGGLNFYTTFNGQRHRSFAITPQGSLLAGACPVREPH